MKIGLVKLQLLLAVYKILYWAHSRMKASQCVNGLAWCACALGLHSQYINIKTTGIIIIVTIGSAPFSSQPEANFDLLFDGLYFYYANVIVFLLTAEVTMYVW